MSRKQFTIIAVMLAAIACGRPNAPEQSADTTFAAMQMRGAAAMGVDQYTSAHVFEPLPDGGRIVLQRSAADSAGVAEIREHMRDIASRFALGDFSIPGFVHARAVPGTDLMTSRRTMIRYEAESVPGGGLIRITTTDSTALDAVHRFLAFQRDEHHVGMH